MQTGEILTMKKHIIFLIVGLILCLFCSKEHTTDRPGSNTSGENTPLIWCGANQKVRVNEKLNDYYAYSIFVQALDDNGNPKNQEQILFEVTEGPLANTWFLSPSLTTQSISDLTGVVRNEFSSDQIGDYGIKITHHTNSTDMSETIYVSVIEDEEASDFGSSFTHEKYFGNEILGDGFDDFYESGEDKFVKNVYIELDYKSELASQIDEIITIAETILNTGGMKATILKDEALSIGSGNNQLPGVFTTRKEMKTVLKNTRQKRDHIHAILATDYANSYTYGFTLQYYGPAQGDPPAGEGWSHLDCARGATGLSDNTPAYSVHLRDSTGCLIFVDNITGFGNPTWNQQNAVAWVLAHEIGHALGHEGHYNNDLGGQFSIMHDAPFTGPGNLFSYYDQFIGPELDQGRERAINTRDILGRDNIDTAF